MGLVVDRIDQSLWNILFHQKHLSDEASWNCNLISFPDFRIQYHMCKQQLKIYWLLVTQKLSFTLLDQSLLSAEQPPAQEQWMQCWEWRLQTYLQTNTKNCKTLFRIIFSSISKVRKTKS